MAAPVEGTSNRLTMAERMPDGDYERPLDRIPAVPTGFLDLTPQQQIQFRRMKAIFEETFELHGFSPFDVPPLIDRKHLMTKGGLDAQIFGVTHMRDGKMTHNGLAFDRTVPMALWVRDHENELTLPYRRYDISLSFRAETARLGRLNGFYQADIDSVDYSAGQTMLCEVSTLTAAVDALIQINVPEFRCYVNHIAIPKYLVAQAGFSDDNFREVLGKLDNLDKNPPAQIIAELREIQPDVDVAEIERLVEICQYRGAIEDYPYADQLDGEAAERFAGLLDVIAKCRANDVAAPETFCFAPGIVRGLNYYTGILAETFMVEYPKLGSIMSGGRYDGLVDAFTTKDPGLGGVGFSIGLSRIFVIMAEHELLPEGIKTSAKVVIMMRNVDLYDSAAGIAKMLREEGISNHIYEGQETTLKKQLRKVNKQGYPVGIIIFGENAFQVKDLNRHAQTEDLESLDAVTHFVRDALADGWETDAADDAA